MNTQLPKLLTLEQAAEVLAISKRSLEREISRGRFPAPVKIGRSSRVPIQWLETYVKSLTPTLGA